MLLVSGWCVFVRARDLPKHIHKHTGPSYKPYCMPSLTVALLLLEWLHDGVYAGRSVCKYVCGEVKCYGVSRAQT